MRLHNVSSDSITITDLRIPGSASWGLVISADAYVDVYGGDAEKSDQLIALLTAGTLVKVSDVEPHDSTAVAENVAMDVAALTAAINALAVRVAALESLT